MGGYGNYCVGERNDWDVLSGFVLDQIPFTKFAHLAMNICEEGIFVGAASGSIWRVSLLMFYPILCDKNWWSLWYGCGQRLCQLFRFLW
mmetsp:Transcript_5570/g.10164  ORF Transcript_5570/g.10164 Transcript_5570/m.10164 type:complete len:89 (+) Transcript_5570:119-385(+)